MSSISWQAPIDALCAGLIDRLEWPLARDLSFLLTLSLHPY